MRGLTLRSLAAALLFVTGTAQAEVIRDREGRVIGEIRRQTDGTLEVRDRDGRYVGRGRSTEEGTLLLHDRAGRHTDDLPLLREQRRREKGR